MIIRFDIGFFCFVFLGDVFEQQMNKILIVSRYVPLAGRAGHFTYLLEMMRYLHTCEYQLELDVLDPWFLPDNIPEYVKQIAHVVIMPASFLQTQQRTASHAVIARLRLLCQHLPVASLRSAWYRLRKRNIPGHHLPDAIATEAEIAFVKEQLACYRPYILITNETFLGNILNVYQNDTTLSKVNIAFDLHHQRHEKLDESGSSSCVSGWNRQKEIDVLQAADIVVAIHEDDANTVRNMLPQTDVICVPFPAHVQPHDAAEPIAGRCLFVGSSIDHNVHGMTWFLREVWPLVLRQQAQATLHVCGAVCESLRAFAAPNVRLLGRVEEIGAEYGAAEVCLIPLLAGSGLKIKLIEALSHGRACVSTSVGMQGVRDLTDRAVLVADMPADFAQAVVTLLQQPEKRNAMETQARAYVTEHLSPEKAYQPLIDRIFQHFRERTK